MHDSSFKYDYDVRIETYNAWHEKTYRVSPSPGSEEPYEIWQKKFTAYINSKPKQFQVIDKNAAQQLFNRATSGVISQGRPSVVGKYSFDSIVSYISYHDGLIFKSPIGHLLSYDQVEKYNIGPGKLICGWRDELIKELVPNSAIVCARHLLSKLEKAHTNAYLLLKKSKGESNFIVDYINLSNEIATYFKLTSVG